MTVKQKAKKIRKFAGYLHVIFNDWMEDPIPLWKYRKEGPIIAPWSKKNIIIRHAGGEINGQVYTNSVEAIKQSVQEGNLLIEMDFGFTKDGKVVLSHEPLKDQAISYQEFMENADRGFTKMNLSMLINFLQDNPQVYIIVDAKGDKYLEIIEEIVGQSLNKTEILNRFIIQLYHFQDFETVEKIYHFPYYILTLYASRLSIYNSRKIVKFCMRSKISNVTMPKSWLQNSKCLQLYNKYKLQVWVHTVNSKEELSQYQKWGVYGVYSDKLSIEDVTEEKEV